MPAPQSVSSAAFAAAALAGPAETCPPSVGQEQDEQSVALFQQSWQVGLKTRMVGLFWWVAVLACWRTLLACAACCGGRSVGFRPTRRMCPAVLHWQTYQKLLEVDVLEHGLLYQAVQQQLVSLAAAAAAARAGPRGLRLLDLGCGDAMQVVQAVR